MYPLELASEGAVEEYCREAFETHVINDGILPSLYDAPKQSIYTIPDRSFEEVLGVKPSLADQIENVAARMGEPHTSLILPAKSPDVER